MLHFLLSLMLLSASATAFAHEGHDHAEAAPAPALQTKTLRIDATTDLIELVAIAGDQHLDVYLDHNASNQPIVGARLELEADGKTSAARVVGDHYRIDAPWLAQPGRHLLVFSVESTAASDLLATQANITPIHTAVATPQSGGKRLAWVIGAIIIAAILGPLMALRGKAGNKHGAKS